MAISRWKGVSTMKKVLYFTLGVCLLLLGFGAACTNVIDLPTITPTLSLEKSTEERYEQALEQWHAQQIMDYEITVDVYASFLPPACHTRATLVVKDDTLVDVIEISTPEPIQLPDGQFLSNPQCADYERYRITSIFDTIGDLLLHAEGKYIRELKFDPDHGYVTYLNIAGGESILDVTISEFRQK
jgi:hypothetical protein